MTITVACDCGRSFRANDEDAGKRTKCPGCGATLLIPTEIDFESHERSDTHKAIDDSDKIIRLLTHVRDLIVDCTAFLAEISEAQANSLESTRAVSAPRLSAPAGTDFPGLRIIAIIFKVMAVVAFFLGALGVLAALSSRANGLVVLVTVAWTLLVPLFLWAFGELMLVLPRIEQNTRRE